MGTKALTVKQLIEKLQTLPQEAIIVDAEGEEWAIGDVVFDVEKQYCAITFVSVDE